MMSKDEPSLETRTSTAFVQGRLAEVLAQHAAAKCSLPHCIQWVAAISCVLDDWKQAEAELKIRKAAVHAEIERGLSKYDLGDVPK